MESGNKITLVDAKREYWKKSWVAYLIMVIKMFFLFILLNVGFYFIYGIFNVSVDERSEWDMPLKILITFIAFVISFLSIKSYKLYCDNEGVWVYSGIFPWSKGVHGVKWRDLDEATFRTGFISWSARSYNIRLSHRFTKSSELWENHIANGNKAVSEINRLHEEHLRNNVESSL